jgi:hypothetical protein
MFPQIVRWRQDENTSDFPAEIRPKVPNVARDEMSCSRLYRSQQDLRRRFHQSPSDVAQCAATPARMTDSVLLVNLGPVRVDYLPKLW